MNTPYKLFILCFSIVMSMLTLASCKKTVGLDPLPQAKIIEFRVTNVPDTAIYGAIDDITNTITVYIPYYYGLSVIDPSIKVSAGSTLEGEVLPVNITDKKSYNVTGSDGSKKTYTLQIVSQNPTSIDFAWTGVPLSYPGSTLPFIGGDFLQKNVALVKVVLTELKTSKATELAFNASTLINVENSGYTLINFPLPATLDTGYYKVTLTTLGNTKDLAENLHVIHRQPNLLMPSQTAKQGGSITYTPFNSVFINVKKVTVTVNNVVYDLPVVTSSASSMELKIPDDFPVGVYTGLSFSFEFTGWATLSKTGNLTVTAK